ncbi:MAG: PaaI family thioesterase [Desulfobacteraceae bacterium]|nr:PaaI family thioesterase [Desulfobacteraceae bacterium]
MNERLEKVIDLPLHRFLGVTSIQSDSGNGILSVKINENMINLAGAFHGGVIYLLCDVCAYGGLLSIIDNNTEAVTHDIQVSVMQPAKLGDVVEFRSEIAKLGKRICFIDVKARLTAQVIASARVTKSIISI